MKAKILVVDDDSDIRESLCWVLQSEDYEVALAANGQQASERYSQTPADLVLLDLRMPGKQGWDIFEQLSSMNPLLQFIIITARPNQQLMALAAGVGALMEKPLDYPALLQKIRELLDEPTEKRLRRLTGRASVQAGVERLARIEPTRSTGSGTKQRKAPPT